MNNNEAFVYRDRAKERRQGTDTTLNNIRKGLDLELLAKTRAELAAKEDLQFDQKLEELANNNNNSIDNINNEIKEESSENTYVKHQICKDILNTIKAELAPPSRFVSLYYECDLDYFKSVSIPKTVILGNLPKISAKDKVAGFTTDNTLKHISSFVQLVHSSSKAKIKELKSRIYNPINLIQQEKKEEVKLPDPSEEIIDDFDMFQFDEEDEEVFLPNMIRTKTTPSNNDDIANRPMQGPSRPPINDDIANRPMQGPSRPPINDDIVNRPMQGPSRPPINNDIANRPMQGPSRPPINDDIANRPMQGPSRPPINDDIANRPMQGPSRPPINNDIANRPMQGPTRPPINDDMANRPMQGPSKPIKDSGTTRKRLRPSRFSSSTFQSGSVNTDQIVDTNQIMNPSKMMDTSKSVNSNKAVFEKSGILDRQFKPPVIEKLTPFAPVESNDIYDVYDMDEDNDDDDVKKKNVRGPDYGKQYEQIQKIMDKKKRPNADMSKKDTKRQRMTQGFF